MKSELDSMSYALSLIVFRLNNNKDFPITIKQLLYRHTLRFHLSLLYKTSSSTSLSSDIANILKKTTQAIYNIKSPNNENGNDESMDNDNNNNNNNNNNNVELDGSSIDLLLDLLLLFTNRLPNDLVRITKNNYINNDNDNNSDNNVESQYLDLMDSLSFASAIIRHFSNNEIDRKRLLHYGIIETISELLKLMESNKTIQTILMKINDFKDNNNLLINELSLKRYYKQIINKLNQILVQIIVVLRNFSLDSNGRAQLLSFKIICRLCSLQRIFKDYPDLLLNCARVTAKLSLLGYLLLLL